MSNQTFVIPVNASGGEGTPVPLRGNYNGWPLDGPSPRFSAVAPSDSDPNVFRSLWVGAAGDVAVVGLDDPTGTSVVFKAVPAGTLLPVAVRKVMSIGTTASDIVGML